MSNGRFNKMELEYVVDQLIEDLNWVKFGITQ
jgi:hypothetical protein